MSRIDEALNRASGAVAAKSESKRHLSEDALVEKYQAEAPEGDVRRQTSRPHIVNQRRVQLSTPFQQVGHEARPTSLDSDARLVSSTADFIGVEQYRRLAASLHDAQIAKGLKVVTVTSALPRDGKTLTTVNLALTLSESYSRRVLVIDADLRRPAVHQILGLRNRAGLNEVLHGEIQELPFITVSPTLTVLTAGRSQSAPLAGLASERM